MVNFNRNHCSFFNFFNVGTPFGCIFTIYKDHKKLNNIKLGPLCGPASIQSFFQLRVFAIEIVVTHRESKHEKIRDKIPAQQQLLFHPILMRFLVICINWHSKLRCYVLIFKVSHNKIDM